MPVLYINQSINQNNSYDINDRFANNIVSRCIPIKEFNIFKVLKNGSQVDN